MHYYYSDDLWFDNVHEEIQKSNFGNFTWHFCNLIKNNCNEECFFVSTRLRALNLNNME